MVTEDAAATAVESVAKAGQGAIGKKSTYQSAIGADRERMLTDASKRALNQ